MIILLMQLAIAWSICLLCIYLSKKFVAKLVEKNNTLHIKFLHSVLTVVLIAICIYYSLSVFDVTKDISKTLLQSSALLLAIVTFAAQQALGNVISGFVISATKPYDLNDKVKVMSGSDVIAEGIISDITIRHTVIKKFDGQSCIVPNNIMDNSVIINTNFTANVGNFIEIEISYDSDVDKAMLLLKNIVTKHEHTINNEENTNVTVSRFTANGLILKTTVWTETLNDNFKSCSDIRCNILKEFKKNKIEIPYNTVTVQNKES